MMSRTRTGSQFVSRLGLLSGALWGSLAGSLSGSLLGIGLAASPVAALAGAWTLEAGTGQAAAIAAASTSDRLFDAARRIRPTPRYDKFELQGLIEYGATDWFTLMLLPSLQHIDIAAPNEAQRAGLGYTEFGGRAKLYDGNSWVLSMQTTLRAPGTVDNTNPAAVGYTDTEVDVRGLLGRSFAFGPWPAFIDLQIAQRFRTGGAPDEFRADLTYGIRPAPRWLLLAQSFNVISEGAGSWGLPSYDYYKLQLSAVYQLTPAWSLQFGGFTAFTGRNALQENGLVLGTWFKF
jgi:protein XagA